MDSIKDMGSDLWSRFLQGDADAFGDLIHLYYQELYNYGSRFTRDQELVKDCIQDLFFLLWKNRSTISETLYVKFYLFKALRRYLAKEIKKKNLLKLDDEPAFEGAFEKELSQEHKVIIEEDLVERTKKIRQELSKLSRRQQEVIYLRFYLDASLEEIAEIMSLNRQSVYNLLHEALKKLKSSHYTGFISLVLPLALHFCRG
jgi:RNA polymerase sigma factor (sigma-70 family)